MIQWDFEKALMCMEVGESFFIPTLLTPTMLAGKLRPLAKEAGIKIRCREEVVCGVLGVRVYREE